MDLFRLPIVHRKALPGREVEYREQKDGTLIVRLGMDFTRKEGDQEVARIVRAKRSRLAAVPVVLGLSSQRHPGSSATIAAVTGAVLVSTCLAIQHAHAGHHRPHWQAASPASPSPAAPLQRPVRSHPASHPTTHPLVVPAGFNQSAIGRPSSAPPRTRRTSRPPVTAGGHPPSTPPVPPVTVVPTPEPIAKPLCLLRLNALGVRVRVCMRS